MYTHTRKCCGDIFLVYVAATRPIVSTDSIYYNRETSIRCKFCPGVMLQVVQLVELYATYCGNKTLQRCYDLSCAWCCNMSPKGSKNIANKKQLQEF